MRIAEHKHRQKASQAEDHSEHAGEPAGPEVLRQAVPQKGFHPPVQPGLAVLLELSDAGFSAPQNVLQVARKLGAHVYFEEN